MDDLLEETGDRDYFNHVPEARLELDNLGNEARITAGTRRSIQQFRDCLYRRFMQHSSDSFLFGAAGQLATNTHAADPKTQPPLNDNNNSDSYCQTSQIQDRFQYYLQEREAIGGHYMDLRVFDFVDPTKQLILKGWNSKLFRKHKLATYNWSFKAPLPLMDSKYFFQMSTKDVLEPGPINDSMISRSIFTPKYGVSARDTLRENCGILFFSKDIDFDYQASLRQMRHVFPSLLSVRYYVPFITFVQALRRTRIERTRHVRVNTRSLMRIIMWAAMLAMLAIFSTVIGRASEASGDGTKTFAMLCMILSPVMAFLVGCFDKL